jgi:hypothetical protein
MSTDHLREPQGKARLSSQRILLSNVTKATHADWTAESHHLMVSRTEEQITYQGTQAPWGAEEARQPPSHHIISHHQYRTTTLGVALIFAHTGPLRVMYNTSL